MQESNLMDSKILGRRMVQISLHHQKYAEKNAIKAPWSDILYRNLPPRNQAEAIEQGFYPCMVRRPHPENADPSSLLWCREDSLFKRNYQFAKDSTAENKKYLGLDFNPSPSSPRDNGTREANENRIVPFYNLAGLITHITVQGAKVDHSDDDSDTDDAPAPAPKPKKQKKTKASKSSAAPKASRVKPLATAPSAPTNNSEDLSCISMRREKPQKIPAQQLSHALTLQPL